MGKRDALDNFSGRLATHSERHDSLLARGYVVVRDASGGVVTEAAKVRPNAALELEFHDGKVARHCRRRLLPAGGSRHRAAGRPAEPVRWRLVNATFRPRPRRAAPGQPGA